MKVKVIMTKKVLTVNKNMTVKEFVRIMEENEITGAPVVDDNGNLIGIISVADVIKRSNYVNKELAHCDECMELDPTTGLIEIHKYYTDELFEKNIGCLMTPKEKIISVSPDDEVEKAAKVFVDTPVHRLLVMENGKIVGIVSTKDVMKGLLKKIGKLD